MGFEDCPYATSDLKYREEQFVFTNTSSVQSAVPEPMTLALLGGAISGIGLLRAERRRAA